MDALLCRQGRASIERRWPILPRPVEPGLTLPDRYDGGAAVFRRHAPRPSRRLQGQRRRGAALRRAGARARPLLQPRAWRGLCAQHTTASGCRVRAIHRRLCGCGCAVCVEGEASVGTRLRSARPGWLSTQRTKAAAACGRPLTIHGQCSQPAMAYESLREDCRRRYSAGSHLTAGPGRRGSRPHPAGVPGFELALEPEGYTDADRADEVRNPSSTAADAAVTPILTAHGCAGGGRCGARRPRHPPPALRVRLHHPDTTAGSSRPADRPPLA